VIRWTFIQTGTTEITDVNSTYITTSYGVYQHVLQLIKDDLTDSEYGLYSINVSNNIGPYFQHDFNVVEESKYVLIYYVGYFDIPCVVGRYTMGRGTMYHG
jgi:hypothetical protein